MKKIALVTCYFQKNYGSMLQAYATQKVFSDMGADARTIDISGLKKQIRNKKIKYYIKNISLDVIKGKLGYVNVFLKKRQKHSELGKNFSIRNKAFAAFEENFRLTDKVAGFSELTDMIRGFDGVVVGSDQLWLPSNLDADYYTLNWVPDEIPKMSLSTSFGVPRLPEKYYSFTDHFLKRINYLSVRETDGQKIVKDVSGLQAELVCDPTLLFNKDEWLEIVSKERIVKEPYIFCYFLGNNPEQRAFVKRLQQATGCKIVSILHLNVYVKSDETFADYAPYDVGPKEFLNLIYNADYVCTDSFHATVFSLIFHKNFFVFRRFKANYTLSTNSRLDSILGAVGLQNRILTADEDIKTCLSQTVDYDAVDTTIKQFQDSAREFIKRILD